QDDELARRVVEADEVIDTDENEIDKLAMEVLMMRHPVASDLRFVTMALKFVVDVERIGGLAVGIAKRALELNRLSTREWHGGLPALLATSALAAAGPALAGGGVTLNGSGSTLSKPFQEVAIDQFKKSNKGTVINHGGGGSGKGRQDLADMVVDFAGSDSPYK